MSVGLSTSGSRPGCRCWGQVSVLHRVLGPLSVLPQPISWPFASAAPGTSAPRRHTASSLQSSPRPPEPLTPSRRSSPRASAQSREERMGRGAGAHTAEPGGRDSAELGTQQALTFALLTPCAAATVAEARVLVRRWEAGRGARVLVGVALTQGPRGGRMGQGGQRVLIRGPAGAAVEVQGCKIWRAGGAGG